MQNQNRAEWDRFIVTSLFLNTNASCARVLLLLFGPGLHVLLLLSSQADVQQLEEEE